LEAVRLENVTCTFAGKGGEGKSYTAVRDVNLSVAEGEFVSVVGPTGCGKSTLLNVVAGLLRPSSGAVRIFGEPLAGINRRAGYMFQSEALMPWRSALANVTAGLEFRGVGASEARAVKPGSIASGSRDSETVIRTSSPAACASAPRSRRC
jgi:NitT/TauT family transport system ATP-binding protein